MALAASSRRTHARAGGSLARYHRTTAVRCMFTLHVYVACLRCMLQCGPLHAYVACCNAVRRIISAVQIACCPLQCRFSLLLQCRPLQRCPLQPILLSVASGLLNPVFSAWCHADRCMLNFRYVLSFPHVAMLPVACCTVDRCMLQRCPLHLVFASTRRD